MIFLSRNAQFSRWSTIGTASRWPGAASQSSLSTIGPDLSASRTTGDVRSKCVRTDQQRKLCREFRSPPVHLVTWLNSGIDANVTVVSRCVFFKGCATVSESSVKQWHDSQPSPNCTIIVAGFFLCDNWCEVGADHDGRCGRTVEHVFRTAT